MNLESSVCKADVLLMSPGLLPPKAPQSQRHTREGIPEKASYDMQAAGTRATLVHVCKYFTLVHRVFTLISVMAFSATTLLVITW